MYMHTDSDIIHRHVHSNMCVCKRDRTHTHTHTSKHTHTHTHTHSYPNTHAPPSRILPPPHTHTHTHTEARSTLYIQCPGPQAILADSQPIPPLISSSLLAEGWLPWWNVSRNWCQHQGQNSSCSSLSAWLHSADLCGTDPLSSNKLGLLKKGDQLTRKRVLILLCLATEVTSGVERTVDLPSTFVCHQCFTVCLSLSCILISGGGNWHFLFLLILLSSHFTWHVFTLLLFLPIL